MTLSIITVSLNSAKTIERTIRSVLEQRCPFIEYIVIDGGSTDGTMEIIARYRDKITTVVSEKDNGMYEAMNKGIKIAKGNIIGILNSDDVYASSDVISAVLDEFKRSGVDSVWGDLVYVDKDDPEKVVRNWKSSAYVEGAFEKGWHPPHPTFFVKKEVYERYGMFRTDLSTSADFELMLRFLEKHKISSSYIPQVLVKMQSGGESNCSLVHQAKVNFYCYKAFKLNGLKADPMFILRKPISKLKQFFH